MQSLLYTLLSATAVSAAALVPRDNVISTSLRDPTYAKSFGKASQLTTVNPGVTYWLSGGGTHNFYGNLDNSGTIIISQTDYLKQNPYAGGQTADFVGSTSSNGNLINRAGGFISLNDYGSASAPTYDWYLHTMENRGSLQFCGRGDTGGSTYQLYCDETCYNYGVIDFEQYTRNLGASFVWRNDVIGANANVNIYNEGAFRLVNVVYHNVQNVLGSGCWVIDEGSVLYLEDGSGAFQNPNQGPTFPNQKIYFTDASSPSGRYQTLHMDTAVYSRNSNFGPQVYGFGGNRAIEFYEIIKSFSYADGVLTVVFTSNNRVNIKIGTGYDSTAFYQARNPQHYNSAGYNAIFYRGNAPSQAIPGVCQVSLGKCTDPEQTAGVSTTTSTTRAATSTSTTMSTTVSTTAATTSSSASSKASTSSSTTRSTTAPVTSSTSATTSSSSVGPTTSSTSSSRSTTASTQSTTSSSTKVVTSSTTSSSSSAITSATTRVTSSTTTSAAATTSATSSTQVGNGPCANGAGPSYTYTASNGDVYGVCLNTDFPGPNLTPVGGIASPEQCAETCSKTAGCIAGSLIREAQTCYLKDTRSPASPNNNVDSIYKISSGPGSSTTTSRSASTTVSSSTRISTSTSTASASATTASTTTAKITTTTTRATTSATSATTSAPGGNGPCADGRGPDRTYTAPNGDVYGVCLNTDFPGQNLGNPVNSISTPEQCADVCSRTAGCIAGSLIRGAQTCYLKNVNNPASSNPNVDSVYKISSGPGGSTTISTSATTTRVSSTTVTTTGSAASSTTTKATTIVTTASTSAVTSSTTSVPGTGRCANGKGPDTTYTAANGDVYGVCYNTDFPGANLGNPVTGVTSAGQCAEACSRTEGCVAGSLLRDSQNCYLKGVNNPATSNPGVDSVYKISSGPGGSTTVSNSATTTRVSSSTLSSTLTSTSRSSAVTSSITSLTTTRATTAVTSTTTTSAAITTTTGTPGTGPCANGKGPDATYTAANGDVYGVCYNTDFPGSNLGNPVTGITNAGQCAEACSRTTGCVAGSLLKSSQNCYLKSVKNPGVANDGVDSVYKIKSGSGSSSTTTTTPVSSTTVRVTTTISTTTAITTTHVITSVSTTTVTAPATTSGCSWVCHNEL